MGPEKDLPDHPETGAVGGRTGPRSASGLSRALLGAVLLGCVAVTVMLASDRAWLPAAVTAAGTIYFALRFTGRLGPRRPM
jgi:hypothetical protein